MTAALRGLSPRDMSRALAAIDLIGRTGARGFEISYDDPAETGRTGKVTWTAIATHQGSKVWRTAAGPVDAIELLAEDLVDGGQCTTCGRPTALILDNQPALGAPGICEYSRMGNKYLRSCS